MLLPPPWGRPILSLQQLAFFNLLLWLGHTEHFYYDCHANFQWTKRSQAHPSTPRGVLLGHNQYPLSRVHGQEKRRQTRKGPGKQGLLSGGSAKTG